MVPGHVLRKLAKEIHRENYKWWVHLETGEPKQRNTGEICMLIISEIAEAMEGLRKDLMDDKLPHRKMIEVELADTMIRILDFVGAYGIKINKIDEEATPGLSTNTAESLFYICKDVMRIHGAFTTMRRMDGDEHKEWVNKITTQTIARIVALSKKLKLDLFGAIEEKRKYNLTRADHQLDARMKEGGKKW